MSKRASLLVQIAGVIAIVGGAYIAWISSVATAAAKPGAAGLLAYAAPGSGTSFAGTLAGALSYELALPRLVLTEPLIWFGLAAILAPRFYRRIARQGSGYDPAYAGYAYVKCPECRTPVPASLQRCPLCGAQLLAPWSNASRPGLDPSGQRR